MILRRRSWTPSGDPYEYLARGYDLIAASYDEVEGRNPVSERVRRESLKAALHCFRPGDRILELGCGTGRDAVLLATNGVKVEATDVSPEMVAATRRRAAHAGVSHLVNADVLPASVAAGRGGPFDGAYSNGAVLNLEPRWKEVAAGLAHTLRPDSRVVLTALNRVSIFELLLYPLVLRPRKAFRKLGRSVPIPVSREGPGQRYVVPTHFLTPKELLGSFRGHFVVESWRGLQVFTPPWNLADQAMRFAVALAPLEALENRIAYWPGVRTVGAIFLITLRKSGG